MPVDLLFQSKLYRTYTELGLEQLKLAICDDHYLDCFEQGLAT
jgi:hypothetical protein